MAAFSVDPLFLLLGFEVLGQGTQGLISVEKPKGESTREHWEWVGGRGGHLQ